MTKYVGYVVWSYSWDSNSGYEGTAYFVIPPRLRKILPKIPRPLTKEELKELKDYMLRCVFAKKVLRDLGVLHDYSVGEWLVVPWDLLEKGWYLVKAIVYGRDNIYYEVKEIYTKHDLLKKRPTWFREVVIEV